MSTGTLPEQPATISPDRELLDVLNVLASLCAGDFAARAEPRGFDDPPAETLRQPAGLYSPIFGRLVTPVNAEWGSRLVRVHRWRFH